MSAYTGIFTTTFNDCIKSYGNNPQFKKRIKSVIDRVLENPKHLSHLLEKIRGIDLRGKRRRHVSGNYVIIYAICEECISSNHQEFNDCSICSGIPKKEVIFFSFGKWDYIYSRQWYC